ncbi:MAG: DUF4234 domain-containing protein, partial [Thermoleophilia bacterium]
MESVPALQFDLHQKVSTDWQTSFWTDFLLVLVTCGIYGVYIFFKLLERRQQHFERMVSLRWHLIEFLREKATSSGRENEFAEDLVELERLHAKAAERDREGDKSPVVWLVLAIIGVLPATFYAMNFLNNDFHDHEVNEILFLDKAGYLMSGLGMNRVSPATQAVPLRSFLLLFLLTMVTFGIYGIYWWYTLIGDPNEHFNGHGVWEAGL